MLRSVESVISFGCFRRLRFIWMFSTCIRTVCGICGSASQCPFRLFHGPISATPTAFSFCAAANISGMWSRENVIISSIDMLPKSSFINLCRHRFGLLGILALSHIAANNGNDVRGFPLAKAWWLPEKVHYAIPIILSIAPTKGCPREDCIFGSGRIMLNM